MNAPTSQEPPRAAELRRRGYARASEECRLASGYADAAAMNAAADDVDAAALYADEARRCLRNALAALDRAARR